METDKIIPTHVSIIMDGNGRWAIKQGKDRCEGHAEGIESIRSVVDKASEMGVKYVSLYAFSEENWNRSEREVTTLMNLFVKVMTEELDTLMKNNVRLVVLGNRPRLSGLINMLIDRCMEATASNTGVTMVVFVSYSGQWDILQAAKKMAADVTRNPQLADSLTPADFSSYLVTAGIPDPDLIIRTSGELRISNYLLWQAAYSEFYYTDVLWPEFRGEEFEKAIDAYSKRDRRYGKTK